MAHIAKLTHSICVHPSTKSPHMFLVLDLDRQPTADRVHGAGVLVGWDGHEGWSLEVGLGERRQQRQSLPGSWDRNHAWGTLKLQRRKWDERSHDADPSAEKPGELELEGSLE